MQKMVETNPKDKTKQEKKEDSGKSLFLCVEKKERFNNWNFFL